MSSYRPYEVPGRFAAPPDTAVTFDGQRYSARTGEPLAVTLHAHGVRVLGRSGKYHRPRGLSCGRGTCGTCVARIDGLPNQRLCTHRVAGNDEAMPQNVVGSARLDLLESIDWLFPQGLDHHHLMVGSAPLNRVAVRMARHIAGLGTLPQPRTKSPAPEVRSEDVDVVIVGGGPAGRAALEHLRASGSSTVLLDALSPDAAERATVIGYYDDWELVAVEGGLLRRLRARAIILATGAHEQPPACPGNDRPGVLTLRAAELLLAYGVLPGKRVIVAQHPHADAGLKARARQLLDTLLDAGARLVALIGPLQHDAAEHAVAGELASIEARGGDLRVRAPDLAQGFDGDALVAIAPPTPAYELPRQMGIAARYDAELQAFVPVSQPDGSTTRAGVYLAGEVAGLPRQRAAEHGAHVAETVIRCLGDATLRESHA